VNSPRHVLHFRRNGAAAFPVAEGRVLLDLVIDAAAEPAGHILELPASPGAPLRWAYVLHDGRSTGLQSTLSRQHLESRILEHYLEDFLADGRQTA